MEKIRVFIDTENGETITESALKTEFLTEYPNDDRTFDEYLSDCLGKNGFLEEV